MDRTGIGLLCLCLSGLTAFATGQGLVNIAMNKTYSQISYRYGQRTTPASGGADGNFGSKSGISNCIWTKRGPDPNDTLHWWEVDLGRTYPIKDIAVWEWPGIGGDYFLYPFTITVDNHTCVHVTSYEETKNRTVTCGSEIYGQVVRVIRAEAADLVLCEVQILVPSGVSQCPAGQYGAQCNLTCDNNCGDGQGSNFCDQDSGVCYGCSPGYHGDLCSSRCSTVNSRCGQCDQNGTTCTACTDHLAPPNCTAVACAPGYYGDQCTSPCSSLASRCTECTKNGTTCTACSGHFAAPNCAVCHGGYYTNNGNDCLPCDKECFNNCDRVTGKCNGNVNVALDKTYRQISSEFNTALYPASNAADDRVGNTRYLYYCIYTQESGGLPNPRDTLHWWEVDLGRTYPVHNITVWELPRPGQGFWANCVYPFTVTVDTQKCVNVTSDPGTTSLSVTCDSVTYGQVVRLTRAESRVLCLCEFQILVPVGVSQCPAGQYGAQCERNCSDNCGGGQGSNFCDQDTGACYDGCTGNFSGVFCEDCADGFYKLTDRGCVQCPPGTCDDNTPCNKTTGHCDECPPGKKGNMCNEECDGGQYGTSRCSESCGQCENTTQCHPVTGYCTNCAPGFFPPLCTTDPSMVQINVNMTLKYVVTVCTKVTENRVETTVLARIVTENTKWPGLCTDSICSNANVTATCVGQVSITTIIEIKLVPDTLRSPQTQSILSTRDVLLRAAVDENAFDLTIIGAVLDKTAVVIILVKTCTSGYILTETQCVKKEEPTSISPVVLGASIGGAFAFLVVVAFVVLAVVMHRRLGLMQADTDRQPTKAEDAHDYCALSPAGRHSAGQQGPVELSHLGFDFTNPSFDQTEERPVSDYDAIGVENPDIANYLVERAANGEHPNGTSPCNPYDDYDDYEGLRQPDDDKAKGSDHMTSYSPRESTAQEIPPDYLELSSSLKDDPNHADYLTPSPSRGNSDEPNPPGYRNVNPKRGNSEESNHADYLIPLPSRESSDETPTPRYQNVSPSR